MYEESFRTPLMMRFPKQVQAGQEANEMVMNIDIASTLLDFTGVEIPEDLQGLSMKPIVLGEEDYSWRDAVYYHYYELSFGLVKHYGVRTDRYKLIHFYEPIDSWELFDLETDPHEMNNLINDPDYSDVLKDMKVRLEAKQREADDLDQSTY
jgi:arylsulfatase A-like enzyme